MIPQSFVFPFSGKFVMIKTERIELDFALLLLRRESTEFSIQQVVDFKDLLQA